MRLSKFSYFLILIVIAALFSGCLSDEQGDYNFGAPYRVVTNPQAPSVQGDSLIVWVQYAGCSGGHPFELKQERYVSRAEVWLTKEMTDQLCERLIQERRTFMLNEHIRRAERIVLITPEENPVTLKSGYIEIGY